MKTAPFNLLLETASRDNILIVTTKCSTACIFCSHNQNPPEVEAFQIKDIDDDELEVLMEFLDGSKKIIIGESATRICEGEPFAHKNFLNILGRLRDKFPDTAIQITTSAALLTDAILHRLSELRPIELNISINSSGEKGRQALYRGNPHMQSVEAVKQLSGLKIPYNGSIVATPDIVGYEDIEAAVRFLAQNNAVLIRVFKPGITKYSKLNQLSWNTDDRLAEMISTLRKSLDTTIILEPPEISSLEAIVAGVLKNSTAAGYDIKPGDIILRVDNVPVISRADAYAKIYSGKDPTILLSRSNMIIEVQLKKPENISTGLVFEYDIKPDTIKLISNALRKHRRESCLLMTSELGYNVLRLIDFKAENLRIAEVRNCYFGGNIRCAGLLTLYDIEKYLSEAAELPQVLLLPEIMFDIYGRDLTGKHYMELSQQLNIVIEVL